MNSSASATPCTAHAAADAAALLHAEHLRQRCGGAGCEAPLWRARRGAGAGHPLQFQHRRRAELLRTAAGADGQRLRRQPVLDQDCRRRRLVRELRHHPAGADTASLPAAGGARRDGPCSTTGRLRYWEIVEQLLPLPHALGPAEASSVQWIPRIDGLDGQMYQVRSHARFRAYPYTDEFDPSEMVKDTRLIGRSVWNTEWLLVIPGSVLLADPEIALERFVEDVTDIYVNFDTYSYVGRASPGGQPMNQLHRVHSVSANLAGSPCCWGWDRLAPGQLSGGACHGCAAAAARSADLWHRDRQQWRCAGERHD